MEPFLEQLSLNLLSLNSPVATTLFRIFLVKGNKGMNNSDVTFRVGVYGTITLLVGLVFFALDLNSYQIISLPLIGVGGSIMATAITNWISNRRLDGLPIDSLVEALSEKSKFIRQNQELNLIFSIVDNQLKVEKSHEFNLLNPGKLSAKHYISMFTDSPLKNSSTKSTGGFTYVEGCGKKLTGAALSIKDKNSKVKDFNGKIYFEEEYRLKPGQNNKFRFVSFDFYRLTDRLIWVIQDRSSNFSVKISNHTRVSNRIKLKINHHREHEILSTSSRYDLGDNIEMIAFRFDCEIIPYQGFEIMWDFEQ